MTTSFDRPSVPSQVSPCTRSIESSWPTGASTPSASVAMHAQRRHSRRRVWGICVGLVLAGLGSLPVEGAAQAAANSTNRPPAWTYIEESSSAPAPATTPTDRAPQVRTAGIRDSRVLDYAYEQVWPTAIRYLRIERGFSIPERDMDAGYVLFEHRHTDANGNSRTTRGSVELVRMAGPGESKLPRVRVYVTTHGGAAHLAFNLLDGIGRKLRTEHGGPRRPAPTPQG